MTEKLISNSASLSKYLCLMRDPGPFLKLLCCAFELMVSKQLAKIKQQCQNSGNSLKSKTEPRLNTVYIAELKAF